MGGRKRHSNHLEKENGERGERRRETQSWNLGSPCGCCEKNGKRQREQAKKKKEEEGMELTDVAFITSLVALLEAQYAQMLSSRGSDFLSESNLRPRDRQSYDLTNKSSITSSRIKKKESSTTENAWSKF